MTLPEVGGALGGLVGAPRVDPLCSGGLPRRGLLPLGFGGQALAGPARERVGLEPRHVLHRLLEVQRPGRAEAQHRPRAFAIAPPELWVLSARARAPLPSLGRPVTRVVIAAALDEAQVDRKS